MISYNLLRGIVSLNTYGPQFNSRNHLHKGLNCLENRSHTRMRRRHTVHPVQYSSYYHLQADVMLKEFYMFDCFLLFIHSSTNARLKQYISQYYDDPNFWSTSYCSNISSINTSWDKRGAV